MEILEELLIDIREGEIRAKKGDIRLPVDSFIAFILITKYNIKKEKKEYFTSQDIQQLANEIKQIKKEFIDISPSAQEKLKGCRSIDIYIAEKLCEKYKIKRKKTISEITHEEVAKIILPR